MKKNVANKKVEFTVKALNEKNEAIEIPVNLTYGKLIFQTINRPNDGKAFKYEEIKLLDRIEKAINVINENNEIELDLADFNSIKKKLETMTWQIPRIEYIEFTDYINSL